MITPLIMPGGSGTRLWPLSRSLYPKQFLSLYGNDTMLQSTVKRLSSLDVSAPITICNEEHRFIVAEQLREIDQLGDVILEPVGRNTAPVVAVSAGIVSKTQRPDTLMLVLAADHVIENEKAFCDAVTQEIPLAERGKLVTFGIVPKTANTGYGYIKAVQAIDSGYQVECFVEKPDKGTAQQYLDSGHYYWNSGMFLFRADTYLEELALFRPDILECCNLAIELY